jgi:hypothetical protein
MSKPLPPPLPPESRTVGQVIAESIRLYGHRFWPALALGLPVTILDQVQLGQDAQGRALLYVLAAPLLAGAYAAASALIAPRTDRRSVATAVLVGTVLLVPTALVLSWFALLAVAYLAFLGLAVPVAVIEHVGPIASLRRARELARADYVHALGSLAALAVVFFLSRQVLVIVLRGQADNTIRAAIIVADLVVSPLLFLGSALLYFDQAARVVHSVPRSRRKPNADVHPAVDAHRSGRADAEVES